MADDNAVPFQNAEASKINIINRSGSDADDNTTKDDAATASTEGDGKKPVQAASTAQKTDDDDDNAAAVTKVGDADDEGAEGKEGEEGKKADEPAGEYTEEQFYQDVNEVVSVSTGGEIKTVDQIKTILADYKKLKADFDKKEPVFPSPEAKAVYDLATKAVGLEKETARQVLHVMSLDLATMTPKDKQFEAFHLDRPKLTREEALKRFEAMYEKSYPDLENDITQLDAHELATANAETKLKAKLDSIETVKQSGKVEPLGPTPEQIAKFDSELETAVSQFEGVTLKFDDSQYGKLDIPMDKGKAKEFLEFMKNPYSLIDKIADTHRDESGSVNMNDFIREMFLLFDRDRISQEERDHLMKLGKVAQIKEVKNTGKKEKTEQSTATGKKSFNETFANALQGAGMVN